VVRFVLDTRMLHGNYRYEMNVCCHYESRPRGRAILP
jgi:hypothetical protein